jgi:hypothetical protein
MLSGIFGKKSDHPLAEIKSVQVLLDNLPKNDALKSLMELTELIESATEYTDFQLDHQFAVLRMLDEAAQPYARKLMREYFTPFEKNQFQENRLWILLDNFYHHSALSYFTVFTRFCNAEKGSTIIKAQLPLLTARAVHAIIGRLKYICARYGQVDNMIWANLALLYKHAEQLQYLNTPVNLYPGMTNSTSVKYEVARLLAWYDSGLSALSPLYMHLTERLVAQYCSTLDIHAEISQKSRLSFDLNRPAEPTRINMGATTHPAMRFVGMPTMQAKLEDLIKVLNKNIVPDDLALGGSYEAAVVKEAAQHILNYLIAPPVRRDARRQANVTLNVVDSFDKVIERTDGKQYFGEENPVHWVTEEISAGGFSSVISTKGASSIGIGSLLGIQPEGVPHWGVAVVRRLLRDDAKNQLRVGAQILSNQVTFVSLNKNDNELGDGQPALWLYSKQNDSSGEAQLLMNADTFSPGRSLKIQMGNKNYLLIPAELQERGIDYDLAKFKLIEQESSSEEAY